VIFESKGEYEDTKNPGVKWSKSVVNKFSREQTRTADVQSSFPFIPMLDNYNKPTSELKSTTEINLII
jgi:hypothetical protein